MWLSLMNADMKGVEYWGRKLGVGDLYGLLACMVTARSWEAITKGIEKAKPTTSEVTLFFPLKKSVIFSTLVSFWIM